MTSSHWEKRGDIPGGTILALAAAHNICLAGTLAGLHRSEDGGQTWQHLRYGDAIQALALASNGAAFASSAAGLLLASSDGGRSWREIGSWQFGTATALVLAPDFASTPHLFAATAQGIFRSLDGGETWQEANFGLLDTDVLCLAIAPDYAESNVLWAGTVNGGLYRSRNAGRAWRESGDGLAEGEVSALAVSPKFAQDHTLFAGLSGDASGVFISTDGGETWQPTACNEAIISLTVSLDGAYLIAAGETNLYAHVIGTTIWNLLLDSPVSALAWPSAAHLVAGTWADGVARFDMATNLWDRTTNLSARVLPLMTGGRHGWLALDSQGHVLASTDHGASWTTIDTLEGVHGFADGASVRDAGASMLVTSQGLQVWNGKAWTRIPLPFPAGEEPRTVHVPTLLNVVVGTQQGQVYISTDGAHTWLALPALPTASAVLGVHASRSGRVYALVVPVPAQNQASYTAEVWMCASMTMPAWTLLVALDGLPAPLAVLQVGERRDADVVVLAAQNNLVAMPVDSHGPGQPQSFVLDPQTVITALRVSPYFPSDGLVFAATNSGVVQLKQAQTGWTVVARALENRPVVSLFDDEGTLGAAVLGGEVWIYRG